MSPSKLGLNLESFEQFTPNGQSAVVAHVNGDEANGFSYDDYCVAAFRGVPTDELEDDSWFFQTWDDLFDTGVPPDYGAINDMIEDIEQSSFNKWVRNGYGQCDDWNNELLDGFPDVRANVKTGIIDCLSDCETANNNGELCQLYIVGHSKGGVFAQFMYAYMKWYLKETHAEGDSSYEPYVMTFGVPPAFHKDYPCVDLLPPDDHLINFVNLMKIEKHGVMDVAVSIGLDDKAAHADSGSVVMLTGHTSGGNYNVDGVYVKAGPNDDSLYDSPDYTMSDNDNDNAQLLAHAITTYKSRLEDIVSEIESSGNVPNEGGLDSGSPCTMDNQCASNTCGVSITETTRVCFIFCWNEKSSFTADICD